VKYLRGIGVIKIRVVVQTENQGRIEKRVFYSNFSKHQVRFLHKSESYTSTDIYKFLWNFQRII
jgi:hypothetical protein